MPKQPPRAIRIRFLDPETVVEDGRGGHHPTILAVSVLNARSIEEAIDILIDGERFPQPASSLFTWRERYVEPVLHDTSGWTAIR